MGLLDRLRGGRRESSVSTRQEVTAVSVSLLGGQDDLEVVGELAYQDALWRFRAEPSEIGFAAKS